MKPLLTAEQAAELLGTSRQGIYRLIDSGQLRAKRLGRGWRIHPDWIEEFVNSDTTRIPLMPIADKRRLREARLSN